VKSVKSKEIVKSKSVKAVKKKKGSVKKANRIKSAYSYSANIQDHFTAVLKSICLKQPDLYASGYDFRFCHGMIFKKVTRTFFSINNNSIFMPHEKKEVTTFVIPILIHLNEACENQTMKGWASETCQSKKEFGFVTIEPRTPEELEKMLSEII